MASLGRAFDVLRRWRRVHLPLRTALSLGMLHLTRLLHFVPSVWPVYVPGGAVYIARDTLPLDNATLLGIFVHGHYRGNFRDAVVVDIGAHHGYLSAYALWQGAKTVLSFEPEGRNFVFLERAARTFRARGRDWQTFHTAVASWNGSATLHVRASSLSHSLLEAGRPIVGAESVAVVAMTDVIARGRACGSPLIVKLDVEGLECDIVEGTDRTAWRAVDELLLEYHRTAPCSEDDLKMRLEQAGFRYRGRTLEIRGYHVLVFAR